MFAFLSVCVRVCANFDVSSVSLFNLRKRSSDLDLTYRFILQLSGFFF